MTNEGTSFVNVYGIVPGDSLNRARSILVIKVGQKLMDIVVIAIIMYSKKNRRKTSYGRI